MKTPFRVSALALSTLLLLGACSKSDEETSEAPGPSSELSGSWKLVSHQCYCVASPLPNEVISFTPTAFTLWHNSVPVAGGSYSTGTTATICGNLVSMPVLSFTVSSGAWQRGTPAFHLNGTTLVLNYGGPCDAPVDTYVRMP
jgi:hypothetical protein